MSSTVSSSVALLPVTTPRLLRRFVELPYAFYRNDPHWVPPLRRDETNRLSPAHNPFWEHADRALWLAVDGGRAVGRVAAIEDRLHNETHGERTAFFGFFEARDRGVAHALLDAAEQWARARRCTVMRGPVNPSLNDSGGILIRGFDDDPAVMMPYNPPSYAGYVESSGYGKAKDLFAWDMDLTVPLGERVARLADRVRRRHDISIRAVDLSRFDEEVALLQQVYSAAWERNWGFVPPTDAEMRQLAVDLKPIVDPRIVLFMETRGRAIGCVVVIPDANQVLRKMNGRLLPFGVFHFLRRKSIITRVRLILLGVVAEYRKAGLYPLLIAEIHRRTVASGYRRGEMSWTLEDNVEVNAGIEAAGGRLSKVYRVYEKPLG